MRQAGVCFELVVGRVEGLYELGREDPPLVLYRHVIIPCSKKQYRGHVFVS